MCPNVSANATRVGKQLPCAHTHTHGRWLVLTAATAPAHPQFDVLVDKRTHTLQTRMRSARAHFSRPEWMKMHDSKHTCIIYPHSRYGVYTCAYISVTANLECLCVRFGGGASAFMFHSTVCVAHTSIHA